jgi:hypothetical protein
LQGKVAPSASYQQCVVSQQECTAPQESPPTSAAEHWLAAAEPPELVLPLVPVPLLPPAPVPLLPPTEKLPAVDEPLEPPLEKEPPLPLDPPVPEHCADEFAQLPSAQQIAV